MQFTDSVTLSGTRRTGDGYLVAEARSVRTGIQLYSGDEVGKPDMPVVRVYRPAEQVFAQDSLQSFTHAPVTMNHPAEAVNDGNWKDLAVGEVSTAAKKDGEWVHLPLILKDRVAIAAVESGKRELSAGYTCELVWGDGMTPEGEPFNATQTNIKINHLAIVDRGRAGSMARIGDSATSWGASPFVEDGTKGKRSMTTRTIIVDGLSVDLTDKDAQIVQRALDGFTKQLADLQSAAGEHKATIAAKDTEIGTLKVDLKKAQDSALKPEDLDRMVADRAALVEVVKTIDSKIEIKGNDADLRRAAVKAKLGDEMVKDASDAEVSGMFKAIAKDVKTADPFAAVLKDGITQTSDYRTASEKARQERDNSLRDGWKTVENAA
ncbi:DUF2213 domain-containing protein [Neorhizobium sp. DAR64872/K0K18]|uniref:DUF2213 domain-containing protein n=1 Tax=Neorhizobium sp. DAR64872/K0K18 TaxID=3421958 RepID=UPI003D292A9A